MRLNDDSIGYDKTKANKQGIISHFRKITPMGRRPSKTSI